MDKIIPEWAEGLDCAVTVCDAEGVILFMNRRSRETFARYGDIIGHSLFDYHPAHACDMIRRLLAEGTSNTYSITKGGRKKIIHQTPWHHEDGRVGGLVELSMIVPDTFPHYNRDQK